MDKSNSDKDINDIFNDILLTEDQLIAKSYEEGYQIGVTKTNSEAFHLGYHRGAELGYIIGYITAFVETYREGQELSPKILDLLKNLKELCEKFPQENFEVNIDGELKLIEANFKKLCAVLRINCEIFKPQNQLSF